MSKAPRDPVVCIPKALPSHLLVPAAERAIQINPTNRPRLERLAMIVPGFEPTKERIAVVTTKYWHTKGVRLTVGFLDNPPSDLRKRILSHMNAWNKTTNVEFTETQTDPQVRITRVLDDGNWSFLGVDILNIHPDKPTMNLDGFTMEMPESEFFRVVRHETGHTLGCPHEHMRKELVDLIDVPKAIAYYEATQGWDEATVRRQVLTPIQESSLLGTAHDDPNSIMCYQIPDTITKDGKPILGGMDIDQSDYDFMATIYPKDVISASSPVAPRKAVARASKKSSASKAKGKAKGASKARGKTKGSAKKGGAKKAAAKKGGAKSKGKSRR
ncbi:MAG: M12 family metallopeptidase [Pyrinomonadaceae bacterium]